MSTTYEDVRLAYNPNRASDMRGELLFKVTFQQVNGALTNRVPGSDSVFDNFFSGAGGWTSGANGKGEIIEALSESYYALSQLASEPAAQQAVFNKMKELSGRIAGGDALTSRIAALFDKVYKVEEKTGTPKRLMTASSSSWAVTDFSQVNVTVRSTTKGDQAMAHLEIDATAATGNSHVIGGGGASKDISAAGVYTTISTFNWAVSQLISRSGPGASGDDIFSKLITGSSPVVQFENSVRRGSDGELEVKDNSGNWVSLVKATSRQGTCEAVAANNSCDEIANSCLLADNKDGSPVGLTATACLVQLAKSSGGLWKANKADVGKMNPKAAFMLLKNLGFKGKKAGNTIKCEPVDEWLARVDKDEMTDDNGKKVPVGDGSSHDHAKVKGYCAAMKSFLEIVVGYVDSNPAILNQGSGHMSGSLATNDPFGLSRPEGNNKDGALSDIRNQAVTGLDHVHLYISGLMAALGQNPVITLTGGAAVPGYLAPSGTAPLKQKVQRFSHRLREVYDHYLARLKGMNKDLSQATKDKVDTVFKTLEDKESELLKWVEYLERYYEVSQMSGDIRSHRISQSDLENAYKAYEKNLGKLRKRTVNLIDIIATLSNATNDAEKTGSAVNLPTSA